MNWEQINPFAPLIRIGGNFGVTFFSSFTAFDFITEIPTYDVAVGALMTAGVTTGLVLSYEARRFRNAM